MSYHHNERLRSISDEQRSAYASLRFAEKHWSGSLQDFHDAAGISLREFQQALKRLDDTYIIRLFAAFEDMLREYLHLQGVRVYKMEAVLSRVGSRLHIDQAICADAHQVRERRNDIVHNDGNGTPPMTFAEARRALNVFVAKLP